MLKSPTQEIYDYKAEPTTTYLLDKLQEESAEVIQAVSKIRRFGKHNKHPDRDQTNLQELICELEDFLAIIAALEACEYINLEYSRQAIATKAKKLLA